MPDPKHAAASSPDRTASDPDVVVSDGTGPPDAGAARPPERSRPSPEARSPSAHLVHTWKRTQNMQVVALAEGAYVGRLDDFQFDLEGHRIYGWRVKGTGMFGKSGGAAASHLQLIGRDVAFIDTEASIEWGLTSRRAVDGRGWASTYRGTQAITRRGRALGAVQDFVISADGASITAILLHGDRLLPLDGRVHVGPAAVIATTDDVVVELGEGGQEPEGPTWWARVKEALGLGEDDETQEIPDPAHELPVDMPARSRDP